MASLQEPGVIRIYRKQPSGHKTLLWQGDVKFSAPAGGAPDGAATSMPAHDALPFLPVKSPVLVNDDILLVTFEAVSADGIDVSDSIWMLPITVSGLGVKQLAQSDFANPAASDYTTVADVEMTVAGYKITEGRVRLGGSKFFIDIQDDTA